MRDDFGQYTHGQNYFKTFNSLILTGVSKPGTFTDVTLRTKWKKVYLKLNYLETVTNLQKSHKYSVSVKVL